MYEMRWYGTKLRKMQKKKGKEIRKRIPLYVEQRYNIYKCAATQRQRAIFNKVS